MDKQAQDRAHRIGQRREVRVLRLITASTIEEVVMERAMQKLDLEGKVIQAGMFNDKASDSERRQLLETILKEGAFVNEATRIPTWEELNRMIARDEFEFEMYTAMDGALLHDDAIRAAELGVPEYPRYQGGGVTSGS